MKRVINSIFALTLVCCVAFPLIADEGFGFGFDDEPALLASSGSVPSVSITGDAGVSALAFIDEIDHFDSLKAYNAGSLFSGSLRFAASAANAEAEINLDFDPSKTDSISLGEAWLRTYWGKLDLEAGLKRLTWGKADNEGILDVVNPLDYSDLSVTDQMKRKIPRPLVHASWAAGDFTKIEAVFLPGFEPNRLAMDGRWAPAALSGLSNGIQAGAEVAVTQTLAGMVAIPGFDPVAAGASLRSSVQTSLAGGVASLIPDTNTLEYAQSGLRLTTTLASQDLGFQYFYGNRREPSILVDSTVPFFVSTINEALPALSTLAFNPSAVHVAYDRYHQLGVDWATILAGFNLRSEFAVNLTSDLSGDDGAVANPSVLWLLGFDRVIFWGIDVNAQGSGSLRLMHDKIGEAPNDCEGGSDLTNTRLMARLSKKVLKDEIELSLTGLWGLEDSDFLAMPEVTWTKEEVTVGLRAGFFGGKKDGNLGQYTDNRYVTVSMKYTF